MLLAILTRIAGVLGVKTMALLAGSSMTGVLTPAINAIMAVLRGIADIIVDLSKSAEGRVILMLLAIVAGFFYLRFHYIHEGRALEAAHRTQLIRTAVKSQCAHAVPGLTGTRPR
jgi:uncharacterized membrane-anchored protein